jgi:hypothetical protein
MLRRRGDHAGADAVAARLDEVTGHVSVDAVLAEAVGSGVSTFRVDSADELSIAMATQEQAFLAFALSASGGRATTPGPLSRLGEGRDGLPRR